MNTPRYLCHQCQCPQGEPQPPPPPPPSSPGDPPRPAGRSGRGSYEVTAFALGPIACKTLYAPSKSGAPVIKPHWPSKPNALRAPPPDVRPPRLGSPIWGSERSLPWENFCNITILQFVGYPAGEYGIWLYRQCAPPTISLWFLLYVFGYRLSFW